MRARFFEIHRDMIGDFFTKADEANLDVELIQVNKEDDELVVEIKYEDEERDDVMNLIEMLDDYVRTARK